MASADLRRRLAGSMAAVGLAVLAIIATGTPASAQTDDGAPSNIVVLTGRAEVRPTDTVDNVFIADGPTLVAGTVRHAVIAVRGDVVVRGTVDEDVVAVDGQVVVEGTGHIAGDVLSRRRPVVQPGGAVDGSWTRWNPAAFRRGVLVASRVLLWIAFTISTLVLGLLLGLLAPRAAAAIADAATNVGPVVGWGLLLTIGLPVVAVLLIFTLVGLPLGLGVLGALGLVYGVAYTAGAWVLGRIVARRSKPIVSYLAGWSILRAIALVPILGGLASFAGVVLGLGAIGVAAHRARRPDPSSASAVARPAGV